MSRLLPFDSEGVSSNRVAGIFTGGKNSAALETLEEIFSLEPEGSELGRGKDATAYATAEGLVYRKSHENSNLNNLGYVESEQIRIGREIAAYASLPAHVQVARTLIAWVKDARVHKIVEMGKGQPIFPVYGQGELVDIDLFRQNWEKSIAAMADVPGPHFKKLVDDEAELRERNIYMDYLGPANLLYDPDKGFTIIDAEFEPFAPLKGKCMYSALIDVFSLTKLVDHEQTWEGKISEEARNSTVRVLDKLDRAGHRPLGKLLFNSVCSSLKYASG